MTAHARSNTKWVEPDRTDRSRCTEREQEGLNSSGLYSVVKRVRHHPLEPVEMNDDRKPRGRANRCVCVMVDPAESQPLRSRERQAGRLCETKSEAAGRDGSDAIVLDLL